MENYKGPLMTNGGAKSQRFANLYNAVDLESTQKGEDTVGKVDF